jgi:phosphate transport system substrate-binding protein
MGGVEGTVAALEEEGRATASPSQTLFEDQASAAGLVLPRRTRLNPWLALGIVVVIVGASVGIGDLTGWAIGPRSGQGPPGLLGVQNCVGVPSYLSVYLSGAVSEHGDPALASALKTWGGEFSNWSGGCVHIDPNVSAGDGYVPELAAKQADFVATAAIPNESDRAALPAGIDLVPEAVTPIAVVYDLPGLTAPLRLNGSVIAGLYDGSITSWDDPAVAELNPTINLSGAPAVTAVHRSDAADINLPFTTYLAESSSAWNGSIGAGTQVAWPPGISADGAAAMAADISSTVGAVGYLEATGSLPANGSEAMIQNPTGAFTVPDPYGASAAAVAVENSTAVKSDDWSNVSLVNARGTDSYPITTLAFFALYHDLGKAYSGTLSPTNGSWLLTFLWWLAADAQSDTSALGFGPLPSAFAALSEQTLENVTYDGSSLLEGGEGGGGGETGEF